ncbi:NifB/NifX family molybdenum-iron cluster-binding protein [Fibrobacter sp. UBA4297]|uniref:NifB/NifX family molybdenum-iron cluster-binding protein n=1 Tax=Fibrobacter sp. UBA4297 TaxID=1946536 RepID=UPI0025BC11F8|nr:NifB/NifX family molybdenum-iron cluster-binding protein [Fibrobacter sp. UBA4297]
MAKYKVAIATNDGLYVNVHFGHAAAFDLYEVDEDSGKYEYIGIRQKPEHCDGTCGHREIENSSMLSAAKNLEDVDYVLCEQIGPHAIQALARFDIRAFDVSLPIAEAIEKINTYRVKIKNKQSLRKG